MRGFTEIAATATLSFCAIWTLAQIKTAKQQPIVREENQEDAVVYSDEAKDNIDLSWGLEKINAPAAWTRETGPKDVVVAVIDTGCDVHHTDLSNNIWRNPGESGLDTSGSAKASNGIDDDENGFVDDVYGWNFAQSNNDIQDEHGHGTHIAGIIGSEHFGVNKNANLMILKYYDPHASGGDNLRHTIEAIQYAVRNGAKVINYSGGGLMRSSAEEEALRWAEARGVLVVAAAGNEGANSDFDPFYPADYELSNIVSVAAIDEDLRLLSSSNFGLHSVDLAAPGKNIYSTLPNGQYGYLSGTSQATAFVSGAASAMLEQDPTLTPERLIERLLSHTHRLSAYTAKLKSGGMLDVNMALDRELSLAEVAPTRIRAPARSDN